MQRCREVLLNDMIGGKGRETDDETYEDIEQTLAYLPVRVAITLRHGTAVQELTSQVLVTSFDVDDDADVDDGGDDDGYVEEKDVEIHGFEVFPPWSEGDDGLASPGQLARVRDLLSFSAVNTLKHEK